VNIRQKMLLGAAALTLIPVILTAGLLWQNASSLAGNALELRIREQLQALRDTKAEQLKDDLESRVASLQVLAAQRSTVDAMKAFKGALATVAKDVNVDAAEANAGMQTFLQSEFSKEYQRRNAAAPAESLAQLVAKRDAVTSALQHAYIVRNPNPLGQKDKLASVGSDFAYNRAHASYHPGLEQAQKSFGFYDIFLIDTETDRVVYTVFKELDFGTSLNDGIAAKTRLDDAYRAVKKAAKRTDSKLSDYAPYLASYNDQAAFAAVPIFDGDKQVGALAMQYPIDKVTETLNSNKAWKDIGLGATGDVFVVGPDFRMRSNARYMVDRSMREDFFERIKGQLSPQSRAAIERAESTIGVVRIESDATRPALQGKKGVIEFVDYRGIPSIGAYAPMTGAGLKWGIVATIDQAEANAPINELNRSSLIRTIVLGLVIVAIAGVFVALFLTRFLKPIQKLSDTVAKVAAGDADARSKLQERDEIGDLGRSFDNLLDERISALQKAARENETMNNSVIALLQTVFELSNRNLTARAPVTEDIIGTVASSVNQLSDETARTLADVQDLSSEVSRASTSVREQAELVERTAARERDALAQMSSNLNEATEQLVQVASLSDTSSQAASQTAQSTQAAQAAVRETVQGMESLRESISEMEKRFKRLGERSQEISTAVNLINTISERTHVLALNASMQAAMAGEAGRGFAVVAEEVQRLSDSSRQATAQIAQLVSNIQAETNETLFTVNRLIADVVKQTDAAQRAGNQMTQTQAATQQLVGLVQQIAGFSTRQAELARTLQESVADLNAGTDLTSAAIATQAKTTVFLADVSQKLNDSVAVFRLPERPAV
jgi:methyl-accepting chemotaxis protein